MGKLDGKVAIVAGSSRGIGKGIAIAFGREGAKVAVVARTETPGKIAGTVGETAKQIEAEGGAAIPIRCDVTDEADVAAMIQRVRERFGRIDILVNSVAVIMFDKFIDTPFKRWELIYRVNVHAAFLLTKAVLPVMMEQRSGHVIHLTSRASERIATRSTHYGSTKAALERFCKGLALEVKEHNIAVNILDPGPVKTEGAVFTRPKDFDWTGHVTPIEVGPVAVHLAQQTAQTMTGQVLRRLDFQAR